MSSQHPHILPALTDREAIADAIYRACLAIDTHDQALWDSAWLDPKNAVFEMGGEVSRGDAVQSVFDKIGPMNTSHHVSNVRVNLVPGESTATVTAYSMSQHFRAGEGKGGEKGFLVGGRYAVDVTRDERDGVWKMTKWVLEVLWKEGDGSVMV